jgi:hypothetical protein
VNYLEKNLPIRGTSTEIYIIFIFLFMYMLIPFLFLFFFSFLTDQVSVSCFLGWREGLPRSVWENYSLIRVFRLSLRRLGKFLYRVMAICLTVRILKSLWMVSLEMYEGTLRMSGVFSIGWFEFYLYWTFSWHPRAQYYKSTWVILRIYKLLIYYVN